MLRWPSDGIPDNPAAWLATTAHRRAIDVLRRRRTEADKMRDLTAWARRQTSADLEPDADAIDDFYGDDRLRLLYTCCHPALPFPGRVALTLKVVAGLSTRQIARPFWSARRRWASVCCGPRPRSATPASPSRCRLRTGCERTAGVLSVIYLVFNAGYTTAEETGRDDLTAEALRLAALVVRLLPTDDEARGLEALLLLQHARRAAQTEPDRGTGFESEEQDRSRWDQSMVAAGLASLQAAQASVRRPGFYRLRAEIAAVHATAPDAAATDWAAIVAGYDALLRLRPSPVIALNRAAALGFRDGPLAGLTALAEVAPAGQLAGYHLLPAVRADLLRRAGRRDEAADAYREAIEAAPSAAKRRFLERRVAEVLTGRPGPAAH